MGPTKEGARKMGMPESMTGETPEARKTRLAQQTADAETPVNHNQVPDAAIVPAAADPGIQQVAQTISEAHQLLPGGVYLIAFNKRLFHQASLARVVDYLATQNIRIILLSCAGDPKDAIKVVPVEELNQ